MVETTVFSETAPNIAISPETHEQQFVNAVLDGEHFAARHIPAWLARERYTDIIDEQIKQLPDETTQNAAELFLFSPEIIKSAMFHDAQGEGSKAENDIDYDLVTRFNRAMRNIILSADRTSIRPEQLVNQLAGFARRNNLLPSPDFRPTYQQEVMSIIRGMLAEQKAINLLCAAGIRNYDATIDEDKKGMDIVVKHHGGRGWYGVDVKSSWFGIKRCAEEANSHSAQIKEFTTDGQRLLNPWDEPIRGTSEAPVIHVLPYEKGFVMSIDCGEADPPQRLAAKRFSASDTPALELIKGARLAMDAYVDSVNENEDGEVHSEADITLFYLENKKFIPAESAVRAGRSALRRVVILDDRNKSYNGKSNGRNLHSR